MKNELKLLKHVLYINKKHLILYYTLAIVGIIFLIMAEDKDTQLTMFGVIGMPILLASCIIIAKSFTPSFIIMQSFNITRRKIFISNILNIVFTAVAGTIIAIIINAGKWLLLIRYSTYEIGLFTTDLMKESLWFLSLIIFCSSILYMSNIAEKTTSLFLKLIGFLLWIIIVLWWVWFFVWPIWECVMMINRFAIENIGWAMIGVLTVVGIFFMIARSLMQRIEKV